MAQRKSTKKVAGNRVAIEKVYDPHTLKCAVCNHSQKKEIEAWYMKFESTATIASEFDILHDSIDRHVRHYDLSSRRLQNTENVLEALIERGMQQLGKVPLDAVIESVKELHKVRGKRQEDRPNENLSDEQRAQKAGGIVGQGRERMRLVGNG